MNEGSMTRLRASIVCEPTLALCARAFGLDEFIMLGKGEEITGGRERPSILADAFEAVIAAIFLDGGFEPVTKYILGFMPEDVQHQKEAAFSDFKTILQEIVQKNPEEKVEKVGHEKASPGEEISYKINVQNTGNVCLDNFIWEDNIPSDYINVTKLKTGTYNQDGRFNLYYKTNFSEDYILLLEDISCKENAEIDFSKELAENEYITNIKLDFNKVNVGFKTEESSEIFAKVKDEVKSKEIFENTVCLSSNFKGINLFEQAKWKTEVLKILPITGM